MTLTLDPTSEQRIQREIDRGDYREPAEVVARALALLEDHEEQVQHAAKISGDAARKAMDDAFGLWKDNPEDGLAYQQRMRDEW